MEKIIKKNLLICCLMILLVLLGCSSKNVNKTQKETASKEETTPQKENKTAVVYFSVTGNTKKVAEYISDHLNASLIEIVPETPYTQEDISYTNNSSRSSQENSSSSARPKIKDNIDISNYDTVVICYPIWYGIAPKILYTFVESNNFSDKTIIPVCTSASSGEGRSAENLKNLSTHGVWLSAKRFSSNVSKAEVTKFFDELNLSKKK